MKHTRVVSTKCTPGFACRAFSDTTLVCFIVNEHTTKCSHYMHMVCRRYVIHAQLYYVTYCTHVPQGCFTYAGAIMWLPSANEVTQKDMGRIDWRLTSSHLHNSWDILYLLCLYFILSDADIVSPLPTTICIYTVFIQVLLQLVLQPLCHGLLSCQITVEKYKIIFALTIISQHVQLCKSVVMENQDLFILHTWHHCWWPGDARGQGISSDGHVPVSQNILVAALDGFTILSTIIIVKQHGSVEIAWLI